MKMKRILPLLIAIFMFSISFVYADVEVLDPSKGTNKIDSNGQTIISNILGTVQWVGIAIAVGWLIYLGIKYVMASADEKASLKGGMMKYLIGIMLLLSASVIVGWIKGLV